MRKKIMPQSFAAGFTLIELMAGLVLAAILLAMGMPSFAAWLQSTQVRTAAESVLAGLQLAQAEAIRRNATVRFVLDEGSGWRVAVADNASPPNELAVLQQRSAEEGTSRAEVAVTPDSATGVSFGALGWVVGAGAATTVSQIDIRSPDGSARPLRVTVSASGAIRMCDPAVAASNDPDIPSDPRSCG